VKTNAQRTRFPRRTLRLLGLLLPLAVLVFGAVSTANAAAEPLITASGSYQQISFVPSNFRTAGGVTFFDFTEHDSISGTFSGTSVIQGSCVTRASGQTGCQAVETFTGTVAGQGGPGDTATFRDVITIDSTGALQASFRVVSGTGALANLHGQGTVQGTSTGSYTGLFVFAP
jgi:hypothetical protein